MEVKALGQYKFGEQASADLKILLITVVVLSITVVAILYFSKRKLLLIRKITSLSLLFLSIDSALTGIALLLLPGKRLEESALLGLTRSTWTWWHSFYKYSTNRACSNPPILKYRSPETLFRIIKTRKISPQVSFDSVSFYREEDKGDYS